MSSWSNFDENEKPYLNTIVNIVKGLYRYPEKLSKIFDHLYLGSEKDAKDIENLKRLGITHIVNSVDGHFYATTAKNFYLEEFQSDDAYDYPIMKHFGDVYNFIEDARISGGKCFIHCVCGINRSGALTVGYVMVHNNIGPVSATRLVLSKRGVILTNNGFVGQLVKFTTEKHLLILDSGEIAN